MHDVSVLIAGTTHPVLFDVGANVGQTTRAMLDAFATPRVFAFEPSPITVTTLRKAVGQRPDVTVEAIAMGAAEGRLPFHVTREHSVNDSLLTPAWSAAESIVHVPVETVTGYCRRHGIPAIAWLKIDAQGFDAQVLTGAREMLLTRAIALYSCEVNFNKMYEGQATLPELLGVAEEAGYRLVGVYEQSYIQDRLSYLDLLFTAR